MKPENVFVGEWYKVSVTAEVAPALCGLPVQVTEIKIWGVKGNVSMELQSGVAEVPVRLKWDDIEEQDERD